MKRLFILIWFLPQTLFVSNYLSAQVFIELNHSQASELTVIQLDSLTIDKWESVQLGEIDMVSGGTQPYSYLWDPPTRLDNINIPNPIASPLETTVYTLLILDHNGCQLLTQQKVIVNASNYSNEESISANFKIYPNPNSGIFSLILNDLETSSDLIITIYNVAGQIIFEQEDVLTANSYTGQINLSHQPKGIYILLIKNNQARYRKIISIQ